MAVNRGLVIVDMQRDFCEGGALPAANSGSLAAPLAAFADRCRIRGDLVIFTQDWHPANHFSFAAQGGPWPSHCVCGSCGAELVPPLKVGPADILVRKGTRAETDGYSAYENTELGEYLRASAIDLVAVCGIAIEYCVRATALDGISLGYRVAVITDMVRAVDEAAASTILDELGAAGVVMMNAGQWLA